MNNRRNVDLEQQFVIDVGCQIFGFTFCQQYNYLLIVTNIDLMGWNDYQRGILFL